MKAPKTSGNPKLNWFKCPKCGWKAATPWPVTPKTVCPACKEFSRAFTENKYGELA